MINDHNEKNLSIVRAYGDKMKKTNDDLKKKRFYSLMYYF